MTSSKPLLETLLQALVDEWGYRQVQTTLVDLLDERTRSLGLLPIVQDLEKKRRSKKLKAVEQVERASADLDSARAAPLLELASRFDNKEFLPSVSDVREFLILIGERPRTMKNRPEAFRQLLGALVRQTPDQLARLLQSARHSGPSQLGPLSDAISAAAKSHARNRDPNAS